MAASGTTALVGAPFDDYQTGSAYIFDLAGCGAVCTESAKLAASDGYLEDYFGRTVAVSGSRVVVGAPGGGLIPITGSAYVFDCTTLPCTEVSKLTASGGEAGDAFGHSLAVSGTTAVVAAPEDDGLGSVYVFDLGSCGSACTEGVRLRASDAYGADYFGASVAVSDTLVVVGAQGDDDGGSYSGSAYLFDLGIGAPLDLDLNGTTDALTDGLLLMRHLFGFSGTTLTNGALAPNATRTDPAEIAAHIEAYRAELDVDASGETDALTDGLLIIRHLFGFTGSTLINGALAPNATRTDPAAIAAYIEGLR